MPSATIEDYIKHIFNAQQKCGKTHVPMGKIAKSIDVVPGTVTTMVKAMAEAKLVDYKPRKGVALTENGRILAMSILRRHRIVEVFLVEKLGFDWSEVHDEAEELEHVLSDKVLEKLDEFLGRPTRDPHGSPIPTSSGEYDNVQLKDLSNCTLNRSLTIQRISGESPEFLKYLELNNLRPGKRITVIERNDIIDSITLRQSKTKDITVGASVGKKIFVT